MKKTDRRKWEVASGFLAFGLDTLLWTFGGHLEKNGYSISADVCYYLVAVVVVCAACVCCILEDWIKPKTAWKICLLLSLMWAAVYYFTTQKPSQQAQQPEKTVSSGLNGWQPPELPSNCTNVTIYFGGERIDVPVWMAQISSETSGTPFLVKDIPPELKFDDGKPHAHNRPNDTNFIKMVMMSKFPTKFGTNTLELPISPFVNNHRLYVFVKAPFQTEKKLFYIGTDLDSAIPHNWDRNYNSNAFEVVNEDTNPVLQVFYRRSNEVQVNGVFPVNNFDLIASFSDAAPILFSTTIEGIREDQTTQYFTPEDFTRTFTNFAVIQNTNAAYRLKFTDQKAIFRYPWWKHPGQLAE